MRDSVGGSMLLNLVLIFVGLIITLFISILSYSKAYRVKNRIVEIIEKHEIYNVNVALEVNPDLKNAGYDTSNPTKCANIRTRLVNEKYDDSLSQNLNDSNIDSNYGYNYCVYEVSNSSNGKHYVVVTFIRFEIPIIGDVLTFPVYGETKILGKKYDY